MASRSEERATPMATRLGAGAEESRDADELEPLRRDRGERLRLLDKIGKQRGSKVIAYVCSDRAPVDYLINDSDVRVLYDHVRAIAPSRLEERIDLFLYSEGGDPDIPWRIVSMLREHAKSIGVLIPYRASSAATMIVLGVDSLVMTRKAELGPIDARLDFRELDPSLGIEVYKSYSVADVLAFSDFVADRVRAAKVPGNDLRGQSIVDALAALTDEIGPTRLGMIFRTHRHTREIAEQLLDLCKPALSKAKRKAVIKKLTEGINSHEHGISRMDARKLDLQVASDDPVLEDDVWRLFERYEEALRLREPLDPAEELGTNSRVLRLPILDAVVESESLLHAHRRTLEVRRIPILPSELVINVSLDPPISAETIFGLDDARREAARAEVARFLDQVDARAGAAAEDALERTVESRIETKSVGLRWTKVTP